MSVNRVPTGFLPLLDAKTLGRTPGTIGDVLSPTIDMRAFYANNIPLEQEELTQAGVNTVGRFATITIPDGESWLVLAVCVTAAVTAAGPCEPVYNIKTPTTVAGRWNDSTRINLGSYIIGDTVISTKVFNPEVLFPSGTEFSTNMTRNSATVNCITSVTFRRLST